MYSVYSVEYMYVIEYVWQKKLENSYRSYGISLKHRLFEISHIDRK